MTPCTKGQPSNKTTSYLMEISCGCMISFQKSTKEIFNPLLWQKQVDGFWSSNIWWILAEVNSIVPIIQTCGGTFIDCKNTNCLFDNDSSRSVFIKSVSFCSVYVKNTFMRIKKNDSNSIFDNMLYKYKNTFNINKIPKRTYNFNYKKKIIW